MFDSLIAQLQTDLTSGAVLPLAAAFAAFYVGLGGIKLLLRFLNRAHHVEL